MKIKKIEVEVEIECVNESHDVNNALDKDGTDDDEKATILKHFSMQWMV